MPQCWVLAAVALARANQADAELTIREGERLRHQQQKACRFGGESGSSLGSEPWHKKDQMQVSFEWTRFDTTWNWVISADTLKVSSIDTQPYHSFPTNSLRT